MRFLTKPYAGILAITLLMLFSSCGKETDTPSIKTAGVQIDSIIETEIFVLKVCASVKQDGGDASTQRGICYGTKALPEDIYDKLKSALSCNETYNLIGADNLIKFK